MKFWRIVALIGLLVVCVLLVVSCKKETPQSDLDHMHGSYVGTSEGNFSIRYRPKWQAQAQFAGIYMALHKGFYAQYGLDVEIQDVIHSTEVLDSLFAKKSDIAHLDLLQALEVNRDSTEVVNIGQIAQKSPVLLVGKKSNGINSVEDFKGKKLGMWRNGSYHVTELFILGNKLDMDIVSIDWSISLFTQDAVDVINTMKYNEYHQLLQAGIDEDDLFVADLSELGFNIPDEGFYVSKEFFEEHPEECRAFVKATMDGWFYAFSHPDETLEVVLEYTRKENVRANKAHQRWMLEQMKEVVMPSAAQMGVLRREDFMHALKLLQDYKDFPRNIAYEEFYPDAIQKR